MSPTWRPFGFPLTIDACNGRSDPEHALRAPHSRRPLVVSAAGRAGDARARPPRPARAQAPRIEDVEESLVHDPSYKVRVDAALILGKLRQQRSVARADRRAKDSQPAVRASAVRALGLHRGARRARRRRSPRCTIRPRPSATWRATRSGGSARRRRFDAAPAGRARHPPPHRSASRRSRSSRSAIPNNRPARCCAATCATSWSSSCGRSATWRSAEGQATYAVGGVIKNLSVARGGPRRRGELRGPAGRQRQPGGGVFLMTSGEATVQKPKRQWRPQLQRQHGAGGARSRRARRQRRPGLAARP